MHNALATIGNSVQTNYERLHLFIDAQSYTYFWLVQIANSTNFLTN